MANHSVFNSVYPSTVVGFLGGTILISDTARLVSANQALYLEIVWDGTIGTGFTDSTGVSRSTSSVTSFSPLFGVISDTTNQEQFISAIQSPGIARSSDSPVSGDLPGNVPESDSPKPAGSDNNPNNDSDSNGSVENSPPQATNQAANPSPNSLSTGAIAGIAVAAAVVGLGLLGSLVFFLLRRRRRRQSGDHVSNARPYHGDQHTATADLMGEKEAAASGMGEGPHSPYSDDGHGSVPHRAAAPVAAAAIGVAVTTGAATVHDESSPAPAPVPADLQRSSSFTPYSDDGTSIPASRVDADRASGARSETPGGRYEHLMEQGMSAEERARVEEEERQLDAEIEQRTRR